MHFCVADEILKSLKINLVDTFILGNLSPDAHDSTLAGNFSAHFKASQSEFPVFDLLAFKNKYMSYELDEFVLGYYCHLITDSIWSKSVYLKYLQCDEDERNSRAAKCYKDYYTLNKILIEHFSLKRVALNIPEKTVVEEIKPEGILNIINKFNGDFVYNGKREPLEILDMQFVLGFIDDAAEACLKEISNRYD